MNTRLYSVAVVGGGAAGMAAAVSAARRARRTKDGGENDVDAADGGVICFERNDEPGRKLLATGNGRCNFSNAACDGTDEVLRFFRALGIQARREADGRLYPCAGQAAVVRDALREEMARRGAVLRCGSPVKGLRRVNDANGAPGRFEIETADGALFCAGKLVIAAGGKAGPQYGCLGDAFVFARRFGHSVVSPLPSLVRLVCEDTQKQRLSALKGVRAKCAAAFWIGDAPVGRAAGEVQFTERGLSGICVFDLSRHMRMKDRGVCSVVLDFAPEFEETAIEALLAEDRAAYISGVVPAKLAARIGAEANGDTRAAARLLKGMKFPIAGTEGWKEAQTTAGGVSLDEVDADTMESKLVRGLFFAGEVLDYDGVCGGFNLNWAFLSGIKAGRAAAAE
jgi:predicted Rossmann fold flavoprotein